ncbi:hypothetical protein G9U51_12895 [Calidifontibacter sp. DB0510]|uniref:Lipoprotein with Yx(FWY)xxD motif n=1 Tax=Metallococcus carri TaxID=1656884 RepID=A0A967B2A9_9MICO|nr:hypothetical protein [Metallococcus carri]NHN56679.1 hypothetical protein [Metallococcus carri]NOP38978.1 hypothetical protein [Calidifontibacter sp. DB2511S]
MRAMKATAAGVLMMGALAACGGNDAGSAATTTGTASGGAATLCTSSTALGTVVVDGSGRTVYVFDKDANGTTTSACTGACVSLWPAVTTSGQPTVSGVSGTVGTIKTADGKQQVTLNGRPLYYYAKDTSAGATAGQGVKGVWWVLNAAGAKVTATPSASGAY